MVQSTNQSIEQSIDQSINQSIVTVPFEEPFFSAFGAIWLLSKRRWDSGGMRPLAPANSIRHHPTSAETMIWNKMKWKFDRQRQIDNGKSTTTTYRREFNGKCRTYDIASDDFLRWSIFQLQNGRHFVGNLYRSDPGTPTSKKWWKMVGNSP